MSLAKEIYESILKEGRVSGVINETAWRRRSPVFYNLLGGDTHIQFHTADTNYPDFDKIWTFFRDSKNPNHHNSRANAILVGINSQTKHIKVMGRTVKAINWNHYKDIERSASILNMKGFSENYQPVNSIRTLNHIALFHDHALNALHNAMHTIPSKNWSMCYQNDVVPIIQRFLNDFIESERKKRRPSDYLNKTALAFAEQFEANHPKSNIKGILVYNHLVSAPNEQSAGYRMGAINVLAPFDTLFREDQNFWNAIDAGSPILDMLACKFKARQQTVRHVLRQHMIFDQVLRSTNRENVFTEVDPLPINLWPSSQTEVIYLSHMSKYAKICEKHLDIDAATTLLKSAKQPMLPKAGRWESAFTSLIGNKFAPKNIIKQSKEQVHDNTLLRFDRVASGAKDMKRSIIEKVLFPLVLLELGKAGYELASSTHPLLIDTSRFLWNNVSVREQMDASSYWHSTRVNFSQRLQSAGITPSDAHWKPLLDKDVTIEDKDHVVTFHSLCSGSELDQEHREMNHCIDTYTSLCRNNGHHVLTMTDVKNNIRSTLTLVDYLSKGEHAVRYGENNSYNNKKPPTSFNAVAHKLVRQINNGAIPVDWDSIIRGKQKSEESSIGYHFRDRDIRNKVFTIFRPLLPRRVPTEAKGDIDVFAQWLNLGAQVHDLLSQPPESPQRNMILSCSTPTAG